MRWLLLALAFSGFILFDIVSIIALCNMLGWSNIAGEILIWLLCAAVIAFASGLTGLHWSTPAAQRR